MCCRTNSICCIHDMQAGIITAGMVDILLLITLITVNIVLMSNYFSVWFVIAIIADVLLIIGCKKRIRALLMAWMFIGMINIAILFMCWIVIAVYGIKTVYVIFVCLDFISLINTQFLKAPYNYLDFFSISRQINSLANLGQNIEIDCLGAEKHLIETFVFNAIFVFGLPIYYIYLWIVVKSHRENLMELKSNIIYPMHQARV